jgi:mono/diheme cytochrome c family protein
VKRLALIFSILSFVIAGARAAEPATAPHPLVWDAMEKTIAVKAGDAVDFEFSVKNQSKQTVTITELRPSCGCTTAEMPATPWVLAPGASGSFRATVDVRGKHGKFSKVIHVNSSGGMQMLGVVVDLPDDPEINRRQGNQAAALANRQAVFQGDCAACHVAPTVGKTGGELFQAACGICHAASPRAAMVPDLLVAREPRDAAYWRKWITEGRDGSLMPGFAQKHGGPLTEAQIESLIEHALKQLPTQPRSP